MKIIAVFATLLALSLAAPTDVANVDEKAVLPEKTVAYEKLVEKVEEVSPSVDSSTEEKPVVAENPDNTEEKVVDNTEDKIEEEKPVIPEEKAPVLVVATSLEKGKENTDEKTISDEEKEKNRLEYAAVCRASTGATEEQIVAIGKDPVADASKAVKCYVKCMEEQYGIQKDEVFHKDVARANKPSTLSEDEFETSVETCGHLHTDDPCDSAYLRYSCYFRTSGEKIRLQ